MRNLGLNPSQAWRKAILMHEILEILQHLIWRIIHFFAVQDFSQMNSDIVDTEVSNDILMNLQTNYTQLQETNLCQNHDYDQAPLFKKNML